MGMQFRHLDHCGCAGRRHCGHIDAVAREQPPRRLQEATVVVDEQTAQSHIAIMPAKGAPRIADSWNSSAEACGSGEGPKESPPEPRAPIQKGGLSGSGVSRVFPPPEGV